MKNKRVLFLTQSALIATLYVVLTFSFATFSSGPIQVRLAEALTVLPYFTPAAIPGVFIGCAIGNLLAGSLLWDVIFGSLATLIGAMFTFLLRKKSKYLAPVPAILSNTIIIPYVLKYAYGNPLPVPYMMLTVGVGELISCGLLGMILLTTLEKYRYRIFKTVH